MNVDLTDNIRGAILSIPVSEWKKFFNIARQTEYQTLTGTPDLELTRIKNRVMIIDELETLFTSARLQPLTRNNDET